MQGSWRPFFATSPIDVVGLMLARMRRSSPVDTPELPASLLDLDDGAAAEAFGLVKTLVQAKLAVNKPGYDTHDAVAEAAVIA